MLATQILMVDHEEADTMVSTLASGDMGPNHAALFGRLKESLEIHTSLEETSFVNGRWAKSITLCPFLFALCVHPLNITRLHSLPV